MTPILVADDGSEHARRAVEQAGELFAGRGAIGMSATRAEQALHAGVA